MKALWNKSFELFRRHLILWVPCLIAGAAMLALARLQRAGIRWLIGYFSTQHSVLGGDVASADLTQAIHQTTMIIYPLGFLKQFLEVCLFVVALVTTKNLVQMILEEDRPAIVAAVQAIAPRWRDVLVFSLKYMAVMAVFGGLVVVLSTSPLTTEHFHELALSKPSQFFFGLVSEGGLAWLLIPAAIRLLRPPDNPDTSTQDSKVGIVLAVAMSASTLLLENLLGKAEATVVIDGQWVVEAMALVNTIITNAPQVFLFIALALLAIQGLKDSTSSSTIADPN